MSRHWKKNRLAFYLTVAYGEQQQNAWNAVTELSVETKKLYLFDQEWARGLNSDDISTVEIAISAIKCIPNKWVVCLLTFYLYSWFLLSVYFFLLLWIFICPWHLILSSRIANDKGPLLLENSKWLFFSGSPPLSEAIVRSY